MIFLQTLPLRILFFYMLPYRPLTGVYMKLSLSYSSEIIVITKLLELLTMRKVHFLFCLNSGGHFTNYFNIYKINFNKGSKDIESLNKVMSE